MPASSTAPHWLAQYTPLFIDHEAVLSYFWQRSAQLDWPFSLDRHIRHFARSYLRLLQELSAVQLAQGRILHLQQRVRSALQQGHIEHAEKLNQQLSVEVLDNTLKLPTWRQQRWLRYISRLQSGFGLLRMSLGDYRHAVDALIAAIEALPDSSQHHTLRGIYYNKGGYALYQVQDYAHAENFYAKALRLSQQQYGELHLDTALDLNNLALLKTAQGLFDEAEILYQRALDTKRILLGENHLNYVVTTTNLASLYAQQQQLEDAEPLFLHALHVRLHVLGDAHIDTQVSQYNLAWLHEQYQQPQAVTKLYQQLVDVRRHTLGAQHPDTVLSKIHLADSQQDTLKAAEYKQLRSEIAGDLDALLQHSPMQHQALKDALERFA